MTLLVLTSKGCSRLTYVPHCFPYPFFCQIVSFTNMALLKFCSVIVQVLKQTLVRHGFTFESETDTEVIPKLAKFVFDKANEEGLTLLQLKLLRYFFVIVIS